MQLCDLQRVEDFEVVFEPDVCGPFSKATTALMEATSSDEQTEEGAVVAGGEEAEGGAHAAPDARGSSDRHGDTTESSGGAAGAGEGGGDDDDDARTTTSPVPSAGSDSDSAAYRDEDLERGAPPPVSLPRGKSSEPDVAGQVVGGVRVLVDLSSGSEPDSEGSSSVPASKPAVSPRKTKELEAAARKAKAVEIGRAHV